MELQQCIHKKDLGYSLRSGTLTYEAVAQTSSNGMGQSSCIDRWRSYKYTVIDYQNFFKDEKLYYYDWETEDHREAAGFKRKN